MEVETREKWGVRGGGERSEAADVLLRGERDRRRCILRHYSTVKSPFELQIRTRLTRWLSRSLRLASRPRNIISLARKA